MPAESVLIIGFSSLSVCSFMYVSRPVEQSRKMPTFQWSPFRKVPPHIHHVVIYTLRRLLLPHTALFTYTFYILYHTHVYIGFTYPLPVFQPTCHDCVYSQLPLGDAGMQTTMHATITGHPSARMPCYMSYTCTDMSHTLYTYIPTKNLHVHT